MENIFLDLLYQKETKTGIIDKFKIYLKYKKLIKSIKRNPPSFETLFQFAEFLKWADFIYGLSEENEDIDLLKKRNSFLIDESSSELVEISFTILPDERTKIHFTLEQLNHMISIDISRERIKNSDDKESSISFSADDTQFIFSYEDQLLIHNINRILQQTIVKYITLFYSKIN